MSGASTNTGRTTVFRLELPTGQSTPVVVASPHSGRLYPEDLKKATRLDPLALRRSEDCYVDSLFADAPSQGAPLLAALYPRAYVDLNREPFEIDPKLVSGAIPEGCNTSSAQVSVGLGTVPRVVGDGQSIYVGRLPIEDVLQRIEDYYRPYHAKLRELVDQTRSQHGCTVLIDGHSMPSQAVRTDGSAPSRFKVRHQGTSSGTDIVLGDRYGTSCSQEITQVVEELLTAQGLSVSRNAPYAGAYTTQHYGRPKAGVHALQIEINRALYMNERTLEPHSGLGSLRAVMAQLIDVLGRATVQKAAAE